MIIKRTVERYLTWKELKEAVKAGTIRELVSSGDRIPVTLKTGEELELDVTFDKKGKLFFVMHDCMKEKMPMNENGKNKGGWAASDLRKKANSTILESFPDDLQEVIAPTKIVQVIDGERIECEDKLFCLSYTQVEGDDWLKDQEPEDSQLDIFTDMRSKVKNSDGVASNWWHRSPNALIAGTFSSTSSSGGISGSYAYSRIGVCLGFCI